MLTTLRSVLAYLLFMGQPQPLAPRQQSDGDSGSKSIKSSVGCSDVSYAKALPPSGPGCEKELFARRGRPFMFPARDGVAFGVSSSPDKSSALYLWADNQTDEAVNLYGCCVSTLFELIDVFDSEGHRMPSKTDEAEQKALSEGRQLVQVCTCSAWYSVPAHTIQLVYFVYADISDEYVLKPGRYTISERNPPAPDNVKSHGPETARHPPSRLTLSIP